MKTPSTRLADPAPSLLSPDFLTAPGWRPFLEPNPMPFDPDLARCAVAATLACLAAVWLRSSSPFWALNVTRPFVLARVRQNGLSRFRSVTA